LAILVIRQMLNVYPEYTTIIIVPTKALLDQWNELIIKFDLRNIQVYVINTIALKEIKYQSNLLVIDECHRYTSEKFKTIFQKIQYTWVLGLSATLEESHLQVLNKFCPVVDEVDIDEAKLNNYVSEFNVYNLAIPLSYRDCDLLDKWQNDYFKYSSIFVGGFPDAYKIMSSKKMLDELCKSVGWNPGEVIGYAKSLIKIVAARKLFFYNHPLKEEAAFEIFDRFKDKKIITYSESIKFMDKLNTEDSLSYHSKLTKKERLKVMETFKEREGQIRILNGGKSICEGIDIKNLSLGVRFSYTTSKLKFTQFLGRVCRKEEDNKNAIMVNVCMTRNDGKITQEEKWLDSSTQGNNFKIKKIYDIDEIKL
jgi:superfamily II DNA or RNA helicase